MTKPYLWLLGWLLPMAAFSQQPLPLTDLSAFRPTKQNWKIVGDVSADLGKPETLVTSPGTGVLVNQPAADQKGHLMTVAEHGDADFSFDFMMAVHSNSGFYLQGRYEIQLLDSWGVKNPTTGDCGGIYKRRELPSGRLYEGHAPRQNACKAPGLWQHMEVSFQAPRFDAAGKKISNAKVLKVVLNGITIHEDVELSGPTGGPISEQEAPLGPVMIQGDHGAVAFRNMVMQPYTASAPALSGLRYRSRTFKQGESFDQVPGFDDLKNETATPMQALNWDVAPQANDFALAYHGDLDIKNPGEYTFYLTGGGTTRLTVNGKPLIASGWGQPGDYRMGTITLPAGKVPFEISYVKRDDWLRSGLGLDVAGPSLRRTPLNAPASMLASPPPDPILVSASETPILRSFMDYRLNGKRGNRVVHAVNVGNAEDELHYTYDLDNAAILQAWRGDFLDTTPMWHDRGDGSSRPRGMLTVFGDAPGFAVLPDNTTAWPEALPLENNLLKIKGYQVNSQNRPTFLYQYINTEVSDEIRSGEGGKMLTRTLTLKNPTANLYVLAALGPDIRQTAPGLYTVGDKGYYICLLYTSPSPRD